MILSKNDLFLVEKCKTFLCTVKYVQQNFQYLLKRKILQKINFGKKNDTKLIFFNPFFLKALSFQNLRFLLLAYPNYLCLQVFTVTDVYFGVKNIFVLFQKFAKIAYLKLFVF